MNDIKETLLDVVPPLTEPPDRLAAIRGRATARRQARVTGTALAALVSVATLGTTMAVLSPGGPAGRAGSPPRPVSSASGTYSMPPPYSEPPKDFPMPGPGACPPSVEFMRMPLVEAWPGGTLPQISGVTLCRYTQSTYDLSQGENSLKSGPGVGDVNTLRDVLIAAMRPLASTSGGLPSPSMSGGSSLSVCASSRPYTLDVVFVHSPNGTTKAVAVLRSECDAAHSDDPYGPLRTAFDTAFGAPYR